MARTGEEISKVDFLYPAFLNNVFGFTSEKIQ
jgi:hypothetical protein